jgi:hypothetical protein
MKNRFTFTKLTKHLLRSQRGAREKKLVHPRREWSIGVLIALLIMAASASWSALTYVQYQEVELNQSSASESEVVVYRESLVEAALAIYDERETRLEQLLSGVRSEPVVDEVTETATTTSSVPVLDTDDSDFSTTTEPQVSDDSDETVQTATPDESAATSTPQPIPEPSAVPTGDPSPALEL